MTLGIIDARAATTTHQATDTMETTKLRATMPTTVNSNRTFMNSRRSAIKITKPRRKEDNLEAAKAGRTF